jgi:hypothetical protein
LCCVADEAEQLVTSASVSDSVTKVTSSEDLSHLYPSTDELMKVVAAASLELPSPRSSSERGPKVSLATYRAVIGEVAFVFF